jgi:hypothetical protein
MDDLGFDDNVGALDARYVLSSRPSSFGGGFGRPPQKNSRYRKHDGEGGKYSLAMLFESVREPDGSPKEGALVNAAIFYGILGVAWLIAYLATGRKQ